MRDPLSFEDRIASALGRYADRARTDVDAVAFVQLTRGGAARSWSAWHLPRALRLALALGLLLALALAAAVLVGGRPSPAPTGVTNGWIAVAANPIELATDGSGATAPEARDIYLTREGEPPRRIIGTSDDGLTQGCPRFSPGGDLLAYGEGIATIEFRAPVPGRAVVVLGVRPDGSATAPIQRFELPSEAGALACPTWSPDGGRIAFSTGAELWIGEIDSGRTIRLPTGGEAVWAPDGSSLVALEPGRIRTFDAEGAEGAAVPMEALSLQSPAWIPGTRELIAFDYGSDQERILAIDVDTGATRVLRDDPYHGGPGSVALSPDGTMLAYRRGADGSQVVVTEVDGSDPRVLSGGTSSGLLWSPDGQQVLQRLSAIALTPGASAVAYPSPADVDMDRVPIQHVSWQAVRE
jgi:hypothetical protein